MYLLGRSQTDHADLIFRETGPAGRKREVAGSASWSAVAPDGFSQSGNYLMVHA